MIPGENVCYNKTWLRLWLFDKVFSKGCHLMCMWMTVAIAVLRYIYVCRQNFNRNLTQKRTSYIIISCIVIGCSIAALPLTLDKKIVNIGKKINSPERFDIIRNKDNSTEYLTSGYKTNSSECFDTRHKSNSSECFKKGNKSNSTECFFTGSKTNSTKCFIVGNNINSTECSKAEHKSDFIDCFNIGDSDLAKSSLFVKQYDFWFAGLAMQIVPSLLLSIFTLLLVKQLRKSVTFRKRTSISARGFQERTSNDKSSSVCLTLSQNSLTKIGLHVKQSSSMEKSIRDNVRTTKMLLAIVVCSVLSDFPLGIIIMMIYFDDPWYINTGQHLFNPFMVLIYINNSINIIFYCTMSRPFRAEAKEIFVPKRLVNTIKRIYSQKNSSHYETDIELL